MNLSEYIRALLAERHVGAILESQSLGSIYHGTSTAHLASIMKNGLPQGSYFGTDEIAEYYAEVAAEDDGGEQVILLVDAGKLDQSLFEPDINGIEEPLTYTLGISEEEVWRRWEASGQAWQDSLEIIGSVRYMGAISPSLIYNDTYSE